MDTEALEMNRLPIVKVGTLTASPDGTQVIPEGWTFRAGWMPDGFDEKLGVSFGALGGWNHVELHAIAHGNPCACPAQDVIDQAAGEGAAD